MGGSSQSKLEKALGDDTTGTEKFFGYENFGNTCYCNSVLQSLYFCDGFREHLIEYYHANKSSDKLQVDDEEYTLLAAMAELFANVASQKKRSGSLAPRNFIQKLRYDNEIYRSTMHQDAHEFLNYTLNSMAEQLERENEAAEASNESASRSSTSRLGKLKRLKSSSNKASTSTSSDSTVSSSTSTDSSHKTWIHEQFAGVLTNETICLGCESRTEREENFLDLSIDVEKNSSVTACLRKFSSTETLKSEEKFHCDTCNSLQEADKRMRIKKLPKVLALHLKRFKYSEELNRMKKLNCRVVFPFDLRLPNVTDDLDDVLYKLKSVVVHIGSGIYQGHYICLVNSNGRWVLFDDDEVDLLDEDRVPLFYGSTHDTAQSTEAGYLLFYAREEEDEEEA